MVGVMSSTTLGGEVPANSSDGSSTVSLVAAASLVSVPINFRAFRSQRFDIFAAPRTEGSTEGLFNMA